MMAEMVTVAAEFTMITQADSFYISGADWVGILGMAYENIAAVSLIVSVLALQLLKLLELYVHQL